jgi:signal transduction histidine kinase
MSAPEQIPFDVDAALLRELGERLVGRADIAVAELVKNAYDADASWVYIQIDKNRIVVEDNGHGMTDNEFRTFWMRIGSPHKVMQRVSKGIKRPLTGSKGVGRLAVQFLGSKVEVATTSDAEDSAELVATVDWEQAEEKSQLTRVVALLYTAEGPGSYADHSKHGTRITITGLYHDWSDPKRAENLAAEIWQLRSPEPLSARRSKDQFEIVLSSDDSEVQEKFQNRLLAPLDIWHALIRGELHPPEVFGGPAELDVYLTFRDQTAPLQQTFSLPNCPLNKLSFEIRVYSLFGRQPAGIAVSNARDFVGAHGGVKIYDNGFRLPYYGLEHDWLDIEVDHSHRKSESALLPRALHVPGGLSNLPTQTRLLGYVYVDTGHEASIAKQDAAQSTGREASAAKRNTEYLQIQVSRDRLADNLAFRVLRNCVRFALDWYAMRETLRRLREIEREFVALPAPEEKLRSVDQILARHASTLPDRKVELIKKELKAAIDHDAVGQELLSQNLNLLGALATAGIFALAFEHEIARQIAVLEQLSQRLRSSGKVAAELAQELDKWIRRARQTRTIFTALSDEESRMKRQRFKARTAIEQFAVQSEPFMTGVTIEFVGIDDNIKLPRGSFAEWSALFQNIFANAANAMIDKKHRLISVSSEQARGKSAILVQDTGVGVNLQDAEKLFEPFERRMKITSERRSLSIGGTGLGLTIVRLLARNLNFSVSFVRPKAKFATCLRIEWEERGRNGES